MDRLKKPKEFLERLGLTDSDYQDSGMKNHIADLLERYNAEQLILHGVSGSSFQHLMLDIETMGNESFSSIVSIGAVEFDIETGKTGKEFYTNVDLQSCIDLGLIMNASTIMWWMQQNEQARKDLTERASLPIIEALKYFANFCNKDYQIWGNSARFDCGILQNAYNKAGMTIPWDFRKERCVRTLVSFAPEIKTNYKSVGTAHNAVDDCKFQIGYCSEIWRSLNCH